MTKRSLYEINSELQAVLNTLEDAEEVTEETYFLISDLQEEFDDKIEGIVFFLRQKEAELAAVVKEIERFKGYKGKIEKTIDRLKNLLTVFLSGKNFDTDSVHIGWRKGTSVGILDEAQIPSKFMRVTESKTPDKRLIKEALESGETVAGAVLIESNNIQVR